ncbi:YciI family protein [Chryseobacterium pennipullorum]|uniref:GTP cyclohydrolase n=1 Tax=Chryseobacterium pennipullorum TaxID=2258963 RepID=A0A3D9B8A8_9FLAO|nr:YciI family protein [Chryseobacterium pennipullorum]REC49587.1 GTP cyclohydrolase [Chryseobacterium pennipullorum]
MFIVSLTYKVPLDAIEQHLSKHNDFLNTYYNSGYFIASGRKEPRTGGIILCNAMSRNEVKRIIKEDPFYIHGIADYDITEFLPSKYNDNFKFFIKDS